MERRWSLGGGGEKSCKDVCVCVKRRRRGQYECVCVYTSQDAGDEETQGESTVQETCRMRCAGSLQREIQDKHLRERMSCGAASLRRGAAAACRARRLGESRPAFCLRETAEGCLSSLPHGDDLVSLPQVPTTAHTHTHNRHKTDWASVRPGAQASMSIRLWCTDFGGTISLDFMLPITALQRAFHHHCMPSSYRQTHTHTQTRTLTHTYTCMARCS